MYFEVRTKRLTVTEKNMYKTVKELRLFQVESYTEAEAATHKYMGEEFAGEDLRIVKIAESKIEQVQLINIEDSEAPMWKVKVNMLDENDKGKIVKTPKFMLIQANDSAEANEQAKEIIDSWVVPTEIVKVEITKICGVIGLEEEIEPEPEEKPKSKKGKKK